MQQKKKVGEGWHLSLRECGEVVGGVSLLTLGGWFIPLNWIPAQSIFCAFFLMIFAFAVRYRPYIAYSAGLVAASGYSSLLWLRPDLQDQMRTPFVFGPIILLLTGILCSGLMRRQRRHLATLMQQNVSYQEQVQASTRRYQALLIVNEELERRISKPPASLMAFCKSIEQIWTLRDNARLQAMLKMVLRTIEAQDGALYLLKHEHLQLAGKYCDQEGEENNTFSLERNDPVVRATLQQGRVCTIHDLLQERRNVEESTVIMAGPLRLKNKRLRGIIVINHIPLLKFSPEAVKLFQTVLHVAEIALWEEQENDEEITEHKPVITSVPKGTYEDLAQTTIQTVDECSE
ncbi:MAG TPA: GAF domain-containing protein [Ktedonobacteraceae bacterium]